MKIVDGYVTFKLGIKKGKIFMRTKKTKKERKRIFLITVTIMGLLTFLVGSVYKDWQQILINRKEEQKLNQKYEMLLDEEEKLNAEIAKLGDDSYLARYAKEKYMLSSDGDTIIKMK